MAVCMLLDGRGVREGGGASWLYLPAYLQWALETRTRDLEFFHVTSLKGACFSSEPSKTVRFGQHD
jgi:hypothetical protein